MNDSDFAPYVKLYCFEDFDQLEDKLTEEHNIDGINLRTTKDQNNVDVYEMYFTKNSEVTFLQKLIDSIDV